MAPEAAAARGLTLTEPLEVRDLPESGLRFDETLPPAFVTRLLGVAATQGAIRFRPLEAGQAVLEVVPLSPEEPPPVRVSGRVTASLDTTCVRCLEPVRVDLNAPVESSLFPGGTSAPVEPPRRGGGRAVAVAEGEPLEPWAESFPDPGELDEGAYDGLRVPLPELLAQALLIELPTDPVCVEVEGCDARTRSLIEHANAAVRASDAEGDPRWAALRALRAAAEPPSGDDSDGNR